MRLASQVPYTKLEVGGALDAAGHSITLGAFSTLSAKSLTNALMVRASARVASKPSHSDGRQGIL